MATYGYKENKCKDEVFTQTQALAQEMAIKAYIQTETFAIKQMIAGIPTIQSGTYSTTMATNAAGYVDKEVTFDKEFTTAPTVVTGKNHTTDATWATGYDVSAINITTKGFTMRITKSVEGHIYPVCSWIAVGN